MERWMLTTVVIAAVFGLLAWLGRPPAIFERALEGDVEAVDGYLKGLRNASESWRSTWMSPFPSEQEMERWKAIVWMSLSTGGRATKDEMNGLVVLRDPWGNTLAHMAAKSGNEQVLHKVLGSGFFESTIRNFHGTTLLHFAVLAERNSDEMVEIMVNKYRLPVNVANRYGETPLHFAVMWNKEEAAKRLLELGADANKRDVHGDTPMHLLRLFHCREDCAVVSRVAILLYEYGGDVDMVNGAGVSLREQINAHVERQAEMSGEREFLEMILN